MVVSTFDDKGSLVTEVELILQEQANRPEPKVFEPSVRVRNVPKDTDLSFKLKVDEYANVRAFFEQLGRFTDPGEMVDVCKKVLGGLLFSNPGAVLTGLVRREKKDRGSMFE